MKTILEYIGNTPLIKVEEENDSSIFAKMEGFNPGGSIKDRIALNMIRNAEKEGIIKKGDTLIEPTSGNTGIGLAMVGAMLGYKVKVIMPDTTSVEKIKMIKAFGGEVILVENLRYKKFAIEDARAMAKNGAGLYFLNQYENMNNPYTHYKSTAEEILNQLEGEQLDYFVAGMGTGGTITGIGKKLKEKFPTIKIIGVQPARDERIEGLRSIKDGFVPPIMDVDLIDEIYDIEESKAIETKDDLAKKGILVGPSSGAAMYICREICKNNKRVNIITIFPDRGERYI
ncbi:MAG TPA: cysteine synthase family protein [Candidatus Pacearchaeota archaeon]|nr:cysteine synthase family protein [Candidatus Pacearchaeota archaeon]HOS12952.1 cysteine synthase family protein [Candidatus Pacearchaeota archaeon]HPM39158.1 cysteine synthase family protein [Candidatus Pacearchaeota archaeon]